jgi:4'-phosphopantetheinyl transferase
MESEWPEPSTFPELLPDAIHVWRVPLDPVRIAALDLTQILSPEEQAHAKRFAIDRPRSVFAASRVALRSLLGKYLSLGAKDVQIVSDAGGKPRLTIGELNFNLAHSGDVTLIAVTRGCPIGVDVERLRPVDCSQEIATRNFHPAEIAVIAAADAGELAECFLRCWTRKEAVLKAVGIGLGYPLNAFNVLALNSNSSIELAPHETLPATRCWLQDIEPHMEYIAAVATLAPRRSAQGFTYYL